MARTTNEQLMAELRRLETMVNAHIKDEEIARLHLADDMEKDCNGKMATIEKKLKEYVLEAVFRAELKPIKTFMAGVGSAVVAIGGGLAVWLITRG